MAEVSLNVKRRRDESVAPTEGRVLKKQYERSHSGLSHSQGGSETPLTPLIAVSEKDKHAGDASPPARDKGFVTFITPTEGNSARIPIERVMSEQLLGKIYVEYSNIVTVFKNSKGVRTHLAEREEPSLSDGRATVTFCIDHQPEAEARMPTPPIQLYYVISALVGTVFKKSIRAEKDKTAALKESIRAEKNKTPVLLPPPSPSPRK